MNYVHMRETERGALQLMREVSPARQTDGRPRFLTMLKLASARPHLLIVDDEAPLLKVIERIATKAGYDVATCTSGAEALSTLMRKPADLALVDLRMPD